jgi:hypothetical protein
LQGKGEKERGERDGMVSERIGVHIKLLQKANLLGKKRISGLSKFKGGWKDGQLGRSWTRGLPVSGDGR